MRALGQLGARVRPAPDLLRLATGTELVVRAGVVKDFERTTSPLSPTALFAELDVARHLSSGTGATPAEWRAGVRFCAADSVSVGLAGGTGLSTAWGTPVARFVLNATFDQRTCAPPDGDHDGVWDVNDECPTVPDDVDTDGDTVFDPQDRCPKEPGDPARFGCPLRDSDGDGIPDDEDNCPLEPGTLANAGCKARQIVVLRRERIEIEEKILFPSGRADVDRRSFALLDQVAALILAHPELPKIRIEGHTDNVGGPETNRRLSQQRAESVRRHLIRAEVPAEKLEAVGYGPDEPLEPNSTPAGREKNRRVEFQILDQAGAEAMQVVPQTVVPAPAPTLPLVVPHGGELPGEAVPLVAPVQWEGVPDGVL